MYFWRLFVLVKVWQKKPVCLIDFHTAYVFFEGYYDTSDDGVMDEDGFVSIMARTDDVINVAGHRISTKALEEVRERTFFGVGLVLGRACLSVVIFAVRYFVMNSKCHLTLITVRLRNFCRLLQFCCFRCHWQHWNTLCGLKSLYFSHLLRDKSNITQVYTTLVLVRTIFYLTDQCFCCNITV